MTDTIQVSIYSSTSWLKRSIGDAPGAIISRRDVRSLRPLAGLQPRAAREERVKLIFVISLCVFCAVVGRLAYLTRPFGSDAAIFAYMGKIVAQGGRYGHDVCDNKFPSVAMMMSLIWRAFGACWPAYVFSQAVLVLAGCWILARTAGQFAGRYARLPTFLYALTYLNLTYAVFGGFQLESMQAFLEIVAAAFAMHAMLNRRASSAFVVGLTAALAAMLKPTSIGVAAVFGAMMILRWRHSKGERRKEKGENMPAPARERSPATLFIATALGVSIPLTAVLIYLLGTHIFWDMPALYRQISLYAQQSHWEWSDVLKIPIVAGILTAPMIIRAVFRKAEDRISPQDRAAHDRRRLLFTFTLLWLLIDAAGVVAQRRMYAYHFLVLASPAALLFGLIPRRNRAVTLLAALFPIVIFSLEGGAALIGMAYTPEPHLQLSDYFLAHAQPTDAVWEDDMPRLLLETGMRGGARYPLTFLFANYDSAPLEYGGAILQDFQSIKPKYIVLPTRFEDHLQFEARAVYELEKGPIRRQNYFKAWHAIKDYVDTHYLPQARIGPETIYRRRGP